MSLRGALCLLATLVSNGCTFVTIRTAAVEHAAVGTAEQPRDVIEELGPVMAPGERIEASLDIVGLSAGTFVLEAKQPCRLDGRRLLPLASVAESGGLLGALGERNSHTTTWVDPDSGHPVLEVADLEMGATKKRYVTDFRGDGYRTRYTRTEGEDESVKDERWKLPPEARAHDVVTTVMALRRWRTEPGGRGTSYVIFGTRIWRADFVFRGPRRVPDAERRTTGLHIEGMARKLTRDHELADREPRTLSIWLRDDEARVPLRAVAQDRALSLRLELTDHRPGAEAKGPFERCEDVPAELLEG